VIVAVADNTLSQWQPFLLELKGKVVEVFPSEAVFLAELSGFDRKSMSIDRANRVHRIDRTMDGNREIFSGKYVRHTVITGGLPGAGNPTETSTWNVPQVLPSQEAHISLVRCLVPFSVTVDVERDSMNTSTATAVATLVDQAKGALARLENLELLGEGTGLQAQITDGATSLTTTVIGAAGSGTVANFDVLLPGTVWDIRTRSTMADPGQGARRRIASVNETTNVITWDTASQASDGGSGNIVHTSADGIYVPGLPASVPTPGTVTLQGLQQAAAITGTFEGIDKAAVPQWRGTDGRGGDTTSLPLSSQMLAGGVRRGRRSGLGTWDFGLGDPAVIDLWIQGLQSQVRYDSQSTTLKSGFSGVVFDGADAPIPMIKEFMAPKGTLWLIDKDSFQLYGDQPGPGFLDDDGGMFRRFSRSLPKEADMLDRVQLGVTKANTLVFFNNLAQAA
jgi:hypothetical protein